MLHLVHHLVHHLTRAGLVLTRVRLLGARVLLGLLARSLLGLARSRLLARSLLGLAGTRLLAGALHLARTRLLAAHTRDHLLAAGLVSGDPDTGGAALANRLASALLGRMRAVALHSIHGVIIITIHRCFYGNKR